MMESKKQNGHFKRRSDKKHLFTGFLYCADCGKPLWHRSNRKCYICSGYAKHGKVACTQHAIKEEILIDSLRSEFKSLISYSLKDVDLEAKLKKANKKSCESIKKLEEKIENLKQKNKRYLDCLIDGLISEEVYISSSAINNQEIDCIQSRISQLKHDSSKTHIDYTAIKSELAHIANFEVIDSKTTECAIRPYRDQRNRRAENILYFQLSCK